MSREIHIFKLWLKLGQGRREPVGALGYFIAPGPSEQTIFSLNKTFAGPGPTTPPTPPLDGPELGSGHLCLVTLT